MKCANSLILSAVLILAFLGDARAIPQTFGNGLFGVRSNGKDFTDDFIVAANWAGNALPGDWTGNEAGIDDLQVRRMKANPMLFGIIPMLVRSWSDGEGKLDAIRITYLDAGAFFGYRPGGEKAVKAAGESVADRQEEFGEIFARFDEELRKNLAESSGEGGTETTVGRTEFMRNRVVDFSVGGFSLRYQAKKNHSIMLTIMREGEQRGDYLDEELAAMDREQRVAHFRERVVRDANGDVTVTGVPVFRQGIRPYCAISTLGMVTHYLGLRLSVEGLAAEARFQNNGTAGGTKLLELYAASAQEAKVRSLRSGRFEMERARRSLEAGFPVLVWRKYDEDRDELHTDFCKQYRHDRSATLPVVDELERASWPGSEAPNHASVITGFNEARGEVIFMESWGEHTRGRRMRVEELEASTYMAFYYRL